MFHGNVGKPLQTGMLVQDLLIEVCWATCPKKNDVKIFFGPPTTPSETIPSLMEKHFGKIVVLQVSEKNGDRRVPLTYDIYFFHMGLFH